MGGTAAGSVRLRISPMVNYLEWMNGTGDRSKPAEFRVNVKKNAQKEDEIDFRDAPLADAVFTYLSKSGKDTRLRVIDDATILRTINNDGKDRKGMKKIDWDPGLKIIASDKALRAFHKKVLAHCHGVRGIQVFAGYTLNQEPGQDNPRHDAFRDWLGMKTPNPTIDAVAASISQFFSDNLSFDDMDGPNKNDSFDGISFDIEGLSGGGNSEAVMKSNLEQFYQTLAAKLKPNAVAFAAGWWVAQTSKHVPNFPTVAARIHTFDIVKKQAHNLIFRAMAYDSLSVTDSDDTIFAWHKEIAEFANSEGVAQNFQLGLKLFDGPGQTGPLKLGGVVKSGPNIERRCREILRPNNCGLFFFTGGGQFWRGANRELNPSLREAGRYSEFHPFQFPLDDDGNRLSWIKINESFTVPEEIKD